MEKPCMLFGCQAKIQMIVESLTLLVSFIRVKENPNSLASFWIELSSITISNMVSEFDPIGCDPPSLIVARIDLDVILPHVRERVESLTLLVPFIRMRKNLNS
jgi:hypothetical protein